MPRENPEQGRKEGGEENHKSIRMVLVSRPGSEGLDGGQGKRNRSSKALDWVIGVYG